MFYGLQIIGILFSIVMIYLTFVYYKRNNYSRNSFLLWSAVWIGFLVMVIFPEMIYGVMQELKIDRTVDFFVISGFLFFSVLIFYLWINVKKQERKLESLVREFAIANVKSGTVKKVVKKAKK